MIKGRCYWVCEEHDPFKSKPVYESKFEQGGQYRLNLDEDPVLWYEEALQSYLSVITHEYHRLQKF